MDRIAELIRDKIMNTQMEELVKLREENKKLKKEIEILKDEKMEFSATNKVLEDDINELKREMRDIKEPHWAEILFRERDAREARGDRGGIQ